MGYKYSENFNAKMKSIKKLLTNHRFFLDLRSAALLSLLVRGGSYSLGISQIGIKCAGVSTGGTSRNHGMSGRQISTIGGIGM